jgi:hypothetical protein
MDMPDVFSEFIVPGVVLTGSATLLVADTGIGQRALHDSSQRFGTPTIVIFLLSLGYLAGILCSELGTMLVRPQGNKIAQVQITRMSRDLENTKWATRRDPGRGIGWSDFSYMRAACRSADGVRSKIESHENVLRVLRSSLVALPLSALFVSVYVMRHVSLPIAAKIPIPICATLILATVALVAFRQRLSVAVRSAVDSYLSIPETTTANSDKELGRGSNRSSRRKAT